MRATIKEDFSATGITHYLSDKDFSGGSGVVQGSEAYKAKEECFIRVFYSSNDDCLKVNFVDTNNSVVGYSLDQQCCEEAFWVICEKQNGEDIIYDSRKLNVKNFKLENFIFHKSFLTKEPFVYKNKDEEYFDLDDINSITFKMINNEKVGKDLYLILNNTHNGYYSHGFEFQSDITFLKSEI